jgi:diketogulonate reductase-like aldo/keto reductase
MGINILMALYATRWVHIIGINHAADVRFPKNEDEVGLGIKDSGVKREDIFLTSKLYVSSLKLVVLS